MSTPAQRLASALRAITSDGKPEEVVALARTNGVDGRLGRRAAAGQPVNAGAHLKLCAACGIDPVTGDDFYLVNGGPVPIVPSTIPHLDWNRVAIKVLLAIINNDTLPDDPKGRRSRRKSLRKLERAWKVPSATVNRAKHGQPVSIDNLLKIAKGLGVHPHVFLALQPPLISQENNAPADVQRETAEVGA